MELLKEIRVMEPEMLKWYHHLHQNPEIELELPETVAYVSAILNKYGVEHQILPNSSGITAVIGQGNGPVIGIRVDMDALAVQEDTGLPYASQRSGKMHACGHDAHTATLLTVARYLKAHEKEIPGRVKLIFQTAEEVLRGAKHMIAHGVLENPKVDRILALHVGGMGGEASVGDLIISQGVTFRSSDNIRIRITGKGGHAASPHLTVDPVVATARIIESLQTLVSREVAPTNTAVISIAHVHAGAETYNVIPNGALIMGGVRTVDPETRVYLLRRVEEVCTQTAELMRCTAEFEIVDGAPPLINDYQTALRVEQAVSEIFPGQVQWIKESNGGSEDAAYYFEKIPGCFLFLSNMAKHEDGQVYPHHHARFCLDETVLWKGAAALVRAVLELMEEVPA